MYNKLKNVKSTIKGKESLPAETIEQKVDRILNNKEPITDGSPLYYTDRKDGVNPNLNPRTDRWEYAIDEMDNLAASNIARREARHKPKETKQEGATNPEGAGGAAIQATK